ncbi:hypothetical protein ACFRJ9_17310 [Paenarthrobacter sp. NPDC056912]|uniref:hypothetical protein n=1 Tax=Paenarthrobacter sp. NPDC056912 TaxID=3345965 RepID=UPI00366F5C60
MQDSIVDNPLIQQGLARLKEHTFSEAGLGFGAQEVVSTSLMSQDTTRRYVDVCRDGRWGGRGWHADFPSELLEYWLMEVRRQLYAPGLGAWKTFRVFLFPSDEGRLEAFDHEILTRGMFGDPKISNSPASGQSVKADLLAFPRTEDNLQEWMWNALRADALTPPVYNPQLKTVDWDNKRLPVNDHGTDFSVEPVVIDPSKEPGVLAKIGRKLFGAK